MKALGRPLTSDRVAALDGLLDRFALDGRWADVRHIAYALATVAVETDWTFRPIREYGRGKGKAYGRVHPHTGQVYYGRGLVQLTWFDNYERAATELGVDLVNQPDLAMKPDIAFAIMTLGMHEGWFAGDKKGRHTLARWINDRYCDYVGARRIINGTDRAKEIAGYALRFETALRAKTAKPVTAAEAHTAETSAEPAAAEPETSGLTWTEVAGKATAAVDAYDTADRVVSGFTERQTKARSFWSRAGGKIMQAFWLLIAAIAGMPWWAWLMVAAAILTGFFIYRRRARIRAALTAAWKRVRSIRP